jgi:hypothetical protein
MFDRLPTELYESILSQVPSSKLQQTLLSVTYPQFQYRTSSTVFALHILPKLSVYIVVFNQDKEITRIYLEKATDLVKEFSV